MQSRGILAHFTKIQDTGPNEATPYLGGGGEDCDFFDVRAMFCSVLRDRIVQRNGEITACSCFTFNDKLCFGGQNFRY